MTIRTLNVDFSLHLDEGSLDNQVAAFDLREEVGRPFELVVETRFTGDVAAHAAVGRTASLTFHREGNAPRTVVGVVDKVVVRASSGTGDDVAHPVTLHVVSGLRLCDRTIACRIFQDMTVKEIVAKVLDDCGIPEKAQDFRLKGSYPKREYCVQYRESVLAFVSRLCEEEGIFFFSEMKDGVELVVFADDSPSAAPIEGDPTVPFVSDSHLNMPGDGITSITEHAHIRSGEVVLRDYDFKRPALDLTAKAQAKANTELSLYDFPGLYVEASEGKRLAEVRLEAEQVDRQTLFAEIDCTRASAGRKLEVSHAVYDAANGEHFIVEARHRFDKERGTYVATAKLLPIATKFRTAQSTPRPTIVGPQTARVVAPKGSGTESIHTDEHGRCKVKFHWDTGPEIDDKASVWMRVSQLQTSGSMALPRVDWEVIVEFLEGNPDRPLVVGKLYNGAFMPPYQLPSGKTRTSLQTRSTPGGAGSNEVRLEDKAGGEEIMIHAERDLLIQVANNKVKTVISNETRTVGIDQTTKIGGKQTTKITKGAQSTIGGSQSLTVGSDRTVQVNAVTGLTVGGDSTTTVGGSHFEMDGNPLKALLAIAAEKAKEVAKEVAKEQLKKVDAKVQAKVDQVMGPIKKLNSQVKSVTDNMEKLQNGDLSGAAGLLKGVGGLELPPGFGGGGGEGGGEDGGGGEEGGGGGEEGGGGGEDGGGEGGGGGEDGEDGGGEGGGGEGGGGGFSHQTGLDKAVDGAIDMGIDKGADALGKALGLEGDDADGESELNVDGPEGNVDGVDKVDRKKGPGHSLNKVTGNHKESVGTLRVQAALMGVATDVGGNLTEKVGGAKAVLVWGDITNEVTGDKNESTLGIITVSRADETEHVKGARTQMVGGAIAEKVKGARTVEAKGPATFVGAFHKVEAATKLTLKCGESEMVIDDSGVSIKSDLVTITAPKIQISKDVAEATAPGGGGEASGAEGGGGGSGGSDDGGSGKQGAAEGGGGNTAPKAPAPAAAAKQADGSRKNEYKPPPPPAAKSQTPPSDDEKKLAGEHNKDPDDGKNHARANARAKVADHHLRNGTTTGQRTSDEEAALQGGHGIYQRPLSEKEVEDAKRKIDYSKPVEVQDNDKATDGLWYTNHPATDKNPGQPGFLLNNGVTDSD